MASFKQRAASIQLEPTAVFLSATFTQNGGDVRHVAIERIRQATVAAFKAACSLQDIAGVFEMNYWSKPDVDLEKLLVRRGLVRGDWQHGFLRDGESVKADDAVARTERASKG